MSARLRMGAAPEPAYARTPCLRTSAPPMLPSAPAPLRGAIAIASFLKPESASKRTRAMM